ncbi:MAG: aldo/keto reductase, partial [Betaproteobacteria bacterium]|nr:aldo/keto reductase [Betaproteobacteria bacterium]
GFPAYTVLQPLYNLMERQGYEGALADVCSRHGVGVIPYFSLASGFLTGKYRSQADLGKSPRGAWIAKYLDERGMRVLAALDQVAEARNTEPGAVALAWLLTRPNISAPIASATSAKQLQSLLDGVSLTLTAEEAERLTRASAL